MPVIPVTTVRKTLLAGLSAAQMQVKTSDLKSKKTYF